MPVFTLSQKIFIIKAYYKMDESPIKVIKCLQRRYGQIFGDDCIVTVSNIVANFESTGSVQAPAQYSSPDDEKVVEEVKVVKLEDIGEYQLVLEQDDLIIEETGELDEEVIEEEQVMLEDDLVCVSEEVVTEDRVVVCEECGDQIPRGKLGEHRRKHKMRPKHKCSVCDKHFYSKVRLNDHELLHLDPADRPKVHCEICFREFNKASLLKRHMKVHEDGRNFSCDQCDGKFRTSATLRNHKLTHTGAKPLECKVCGANFRAHMTLSLHMRLHTGERPFSCEYCDKKFIGGPSLNTHLKKYHPEAYKCHCKLCDNIFKNEQALQTHLEKKHGTSIRPDLEGITIRLAKPSPMLSP